jgi:hypothetical protein
MVYCDYSQICFVNNWVVSVLRVLFTSQKQVSEVFNGNDGCQFKYAVESLVVVVVQANNVSKSSLKTNACNSYGYNLAETTQKLVVL